MRKMRMIISRRNNEREKENAHQRDFSRRKFLPSISCSYEEYGNRLPTIGKDLDNEGVNVCWLRTQEISYKHRVQNGEEKTTDKTKTNVKFISKFIEKSQRRYTFSLIVFSSERENRDETSIFFYVCLHCLLFYSNHQTQKQLYSNDLTFPSQK